MKFGTIVPRLFSSKYASIDANKLMCVRGCHRNSDMTSYLQYGDHEVILQKTSSPPRVTSLACSMRYSS